MLLLPFSGLCSQKMTSSIASASMGVSVPGICRLGFDLNRDHARKKKGKFRISGLADSPAYNTKQKIPPAKFYHDVLKVARENFTQEISFRSKDKDISLAKALLYVAAENEAFLAYNREMDACSLQNERLGASGASSSQDWDSIDDMPLAGKTISQWLEELDAIAKEVQAELVSRDIGCHLVEVLEAVNIVLFESRGFERSPVIVDSKCSYMHTVLSSGRGSAIMLSIIYIEVCRRLNLNIVGSRVGEEFLIWPQTGNPEELFKISSGRSLFGVVNGNCVEDPRSKASDLNSDSLSGLDIATNRDIIGIALANLIRLHWKRASRMNHGLMLTTPLRRVYDANDKFNKSDGSDVPLLRPRDLRLAIMASEKLLILQPHNWALRRDHGMMLYFCRDYEEAVQELSICMAFAPEEEAEVLEPFVEKLHLLRLESSWKSLGRVNGFLICLANILYTQHRSPYRKVTGLLPAYSCSILTLSVLTNLVLHGPRDHIIKLKKYQAEILVVDQSLEDNFMVQGGLYYPVYTCDDYHILVADL